MKQVLLVGGGELKEGYRNVEWDRYSKVCTTNYSILDCPRFSDIWVCGLVKNKINSLYPKYKYKYAEALIYPTTPHINKRTVLLPSFSIIPISIYRKLYDEIGSKPSTGLVGIEVLLRKNYNIDLLGFDFGKSKNRYTKQEAYSVHNLDKEYLYLSPFIGGGRIKILD